MASNSLSDFFEKTNFFETNFLGPTSPDDIFSILEALQGLSPEFTPVTPLNETSMGSKDGEEMQVAETISTRTRPVANKSSSSSGVQDSETAVEVSPKCKRQKVKGSSDNSLEEGNKDGEQKMCHIRVEKNRRKQMNEHLSLLKSLMPSFYVKRGDQASIIGGVVDYIKELQLVIQSLEAKKQRQVYTESILSPPFISSPRFSPLSPRKPQIIISPKLTISISPNTPQPNNPYKPWLHQQGYLSPTMASSLEPSPSSSSSSSSSSTSSIHDNATDLASNSKSAMADIEVKFCGSNLVLNTMSHRVHGQVAKIISVLDQLLLEILQVNISTIDETMVLSFTIKIGIECPFSAEELAHQIQKTFC